MKNSSTSYIAGLILIIFGGVWLTSNIGMFDFDVWEYFWPSVFLTIGIVLAVKGRALFIATLFIFFGALNLASSIFYVNFDYLFENFWPIILIALGLLILFRKRDRDRKYQQCGNADWKDLNRKDRRWRHHRRDDRATGNPFYYNGTENDSKTNVNTDSNTDTKTDSNTSTGTDNSGNKGTSTGTGTNYGSHSGDWDFHNNFTFHSDQYNPLDIDKIDEVAILTSIRKFITSQNFKGGRITAILGGGIVDLSGAKLAEGENVLELTSIMGGVSFRVPQNWKVIVNVHSIFGGFEDKRRYFNPVEPEGGSVLIIKGTVLMGGGTLTF